jgi:hypothetical protein
LELQGARFVRIPIGLKSPKNNDWHKHPLTVSEIDIEKDNIGIILNHSSDGIVAIDFDGSSAIDHFHKLFPNTVLPDTVAFTSTRVGRHQRLFKIKQEYQEYLSLKQLKTGVIGDDGKHEQLELRWQYDKAAQSVLPPSTVTDDKGTRTYRWVEGLSPNEVIIQDLPEEILSYWLLLCNDISEKPMYDTNIDLSHTEDMVVHLAETLKRYYNTLNYEEWIRVAWAFKNSIGENDALSIMQYFWPEEQRGEYRKLMRSRPNGKTCTLGTIRYMIKQKGGHCANNDDEILLTKLLNEKRKKAQKP